MHLGRVVEDGGRDGAAEVHVEARPVALRVWRAEAGQTGVRAAGQEALLLDAAQRRLRRSARCKQAGREAKGNRNESGSHHNLKLSLVPHVAVSPGRQGGRPAHRVGQRRGLSLRLLAVRCAASSGTLVRSDASGVATPAIPRGATRPGSSGASLNIEIASAPRMS